MAQSENGTKGMTWTDVAPSDAAPMHPTDDRGRKIPLRVLVVHGCRADDVSKVKQAIELASLPGARDSVEYVTSHAVRMAIIKNAEKVLAYVLATGGRVPVYSDIRSIEGLPTRGILELLLAYGWDINARWRRSHPFLWDGLDDHDLVVWALDHGASINPRGEEPYTDNEPLRNHTDCTPLLEEAVRHGCDASTFDLLREKGAPITRRVLHFAVERATGSTEPYVSNRMAFVRHLLDKYKLDVNALDHVSAYMGNHCGTPLTYIACRRSDCRDIVELLLERGADPDLCIDPPGYSAMRYAKQSDNSQFLDIVAAWRRREIVGDGKAL